MKIKVNGQTIYLAKHKSGTMVKINDIVKFLPMDMDKALSFMEKIGVL